MIVIAIKLRVIFMFKKDFKAVFKTDGNTAMKKEIS